MHQKVIALRQIHCLTRGRAIALAGAEWGAEGLLEAVKSCPARQPESIVEAAFAALDEFSGRRQTDDATILAALVH